MKKDLKFEDALMRLEQIVNQLESGDITLDDSMKIFEEGNQLVKYCFDKLNSAEEKIKKLTIDSEGKLLQEDFD